MLVIFMTNTKGYSYISKKRTILRQTKILTKLIFKLRSAIHQIEDHQELENQVF